MNGRKPPASEVLVTRALATLWPVPCQACIGQPTLVCIPDEDAPVPEFQVGTCRGCGRVLTTVPVLIGICCDLI